MTTPLFAAAGTGSAAEGLLNAIWRDDGTDLYTTYRQLREAAPVLRTGAGALVLSTYDDCDTALRHRGLGKSDTIPEVAGGLDGPTRALLADVRRSMLFTNPPDHTRLRAVVGSAFTARHVDDLGPAIAARTDRLLDKLAARPGGDFMSGVALPLAVHVIADLIGIPGTDRGRFLTLAHDVSVLVKPQLDAATLTRAIAAYTELRDYFANLIALRRAHPTSDLLSRLAVSRDRETLDDMEVIATTIVLFDAGFETTTNLLGNGLHALLSHPDQLALLRSSPDLMASAVDEMLRYDAPVQLDRRIVLEPSTLAGEELTPGQLVVTLLGSANRDPDRFPDPDRFDVRRDAGPGLAFASGIHFCLGSPLARIEGTTFFSRLLDRFATIQVTGDPKRRPGVARGFVSLPITLS
jgi:cytochrome P450